MSPTEFFIEPFRYDFMQRALFSAMLLGVGGGLLGPILVLRRLSLMGDALSHSLLPGIALAWILCGPSTAALFLGALSAGALTALGGAMVSRLTRIKEDAAFGALFLVFFAGGIALVSRMPTQVHLAHFLFGNVLGVSSGDLKLVGGICLITLLALALFRRPILLETFDPVFHRATGGRGTLTHLGFLALTVLNLVAGLQTMGVILALGLFLLPAVSALLWCDRLAKLFLVSVGIALASCLCGILVSYHAGISSGPAIVLCLGAVFLTSALCSPHHGLLGRIIQRLRPHGAVRHTTE